MDTDKFKISKEPGGHHHMLGQLLGDWQGVARTWFEPGKLADESPIQGTICPLIGGRFVLHEYEGALIGEAMHGMAIMGYHITKGLFECAWIDNLHMGTGILFSEAQGHDSGFSVLGRYPDTGGGPDWGWRTEVQIVDKDHIVITAYNISPSGEGAKAIEIAYERRLKS